MSTSFESHRSLPYVAIALVHVSCLRLGFESEGVQDADASNGDHDVVVEDAEVMIDAASDEVDGGSPCGPAYQRALTIHAEQVGLDRVGTLPSTGFPVLVRLSGEWLRTMETDPVRGRVESAIGDDIDFVTRGSRTPLPREIERFDGDVGRLVAWVRLDNLSKAEDTTFYITYGGRCAGASGSDPAEVWRSGYLGVWHLAEEPDALAGNAEVRDSAGRGLHGDSVGMSATASTAGVIETGLRFDGTSAYVTTGYHDEVRVMTSVSAEAWMRSRLDGTFDDVVSDYGLDGSDGKWVLGTNNAERAIVFDLAPEDCRTSSWIRAGNRSDTVVRDRWHHVVGTYDGVTIKVFLDGVEIDATPYALGLSPCGGSIAIGVLGVGVRLNFFMGSIDEVRIASEALSPDWIRTSFNSQAHPGDVGVDGFYRVGEEERLR